jgi:hypothetical protein
MKNAFVGFASSDLRSLSNLIGDVIGVKFSRQESRARGGEYYIAERDDVRFYLQRSRDLIYGNTFEHPESNNHAFLYLESQKDVSEFCEKISQALSNHLISR